MRYPKKLTNLNTSGFGHLVLLIALVVVVAVGGVGYAVYRNQQKAHATNYAAIMTGGPSFPGGSITACKTYTATGYNINAYYFKPATAKNAYYRIQTQRPVKTGGTIAGNGIRVNTVSSVQNTAFYYNVVGGLSASMNTAAADQVYVEVGTLVNGRTTTRGHFNGAWVTPQSVKTLPHC